VKVGSIPGLLALSKKHTWERHGVGISVALQLSPRHKAPTKVTSICPHLRKHHEEHHGDNAERDNVKNDHLVDHDNKVTSGSVAEGCDTTSSYRDLRASCQHGLEKGESQPPKEEREREREREHSPKQEPQHVEPSGTRDCTLHDRDQDGKQHAMLAIQRAVQLDWPARVIETTYHIGVRAITASCQHKEQRERTTKP